MARAWVIMAILALAGCGGTSNGVEEAPDAAFTAYAGVDEVAQVNDILRLDGSVLNTTSASESTATFTYQWQQTQGAPVIWPEGQNSASPLIILPATADELEFELLVSDGSEQASDTMAVSVTACEAEAGTIYTDCLSSEFGPFLAYASSPTVGGIYFNGDAERHVQWQRIDSGDSDHGEVVEVSWNANDPYHEVDANGWFGVATKNNDVLAAVDLSAYAAGTLQFDMRLVYHESPGAASPFDLKLECIYPCVSGYFPIAGVEANYDWQTYSFSIAQMIASGLDITQVNHVLVMHPRWAAQEQNVTVQIDNIRLLPTYTAPTPDDGCVGSGNVSYYLAKVDAPTGEQQNAYNLITAAMDVAVAKYNCYTNLTRELYVEYNPSVATADGSTNGTIRFGATSSMHYVTAMHEIAHVFGVGASNYRTLVVNGVFTGSRATQALRELTGDGAALIYSDGTHLWPYGLNYISEGGTEQDLMFHCLIIEAMVADLLAL